MEGKTKASHPQIGARTVAFGDSTGMPLHPTPLQRWRPPEPQWRKGGRGEDFLEGVPERSASGLNPGTPLSVYMHPTLDIQSLGPCDVACGSCVHCRVSDALRNPAA